MATKTQKKKVEKMGMERNKEEKERIKKARKGRE